MENALTPPVKWPVKTSPEDVLLIFKAIAETISQRDSAIVAAAYLESKIKEIGASVAPGFVDVKTSTGHCLQLLQALGILDGQVREALTRIFNIRNAFAHDPTCPELDDQKIAPELHVAGFQRFAWLCKALQLSDLQRKKFAGLCTSLRRLVRFSALTV